jgi:IS1 family transposase
MRNILIYHIKKEIRPVGSEQYEVRIRSATDRNTRETVGAAFGDRGDKTCLKLRKSLPAGYRKHAVIYTDYRKSYADILPSERHRAVGKESGETAHIGRFNNMLRRRCPPTEQETLSFSKNEAVHEKRIRIFINSYNKRLSV